MLGFNAYAQTYTFTCPTTTTTWTVPAGVTAINVDVIGAEGGLNGGGGGLPTGTPGYGGRTQATLAVTPGQVLNIYVGGVGANGTNTGNAAGGFNGGGMSYHWPTVPGTCGGGGGGASDIRIGGVALANRVVVGAGGGGCGYDGACGTPAQNGGDGGGITGASVTTCDATLSSATYGYTTIIHSGGGTSTTGGAGGLICCTAVYATGGAGTLGVGGAGSNNGGIAGGGGGGYYGGGGGCWMGGGGGSSYADATIATGVTYTSGYNAGCGQVVITIACSAGTITGTTGNVCEGSTINLTDATAGGTWSTTAGTGTVSVGTSGLVSGITAGTATVSYTMAAGCYATYVVTVTPTPGPINGILTVCQGLTTSLSNSVTGGVWSTTSGSGSVTIGSTGIVTGGAVGTATIIYTMAGLCSKATVVTVNASPSAILGVTSVCVGLTTSLSDAVTGGTWFSSNTAAATIGSTGIVTGVGTGGTSVITYTMPGGCYITTTVNVNPAPSAILGIPSVCQGLTTSLSNTVTGGVWASNPVTVATISATGLVSGINGGTAIITYTSANCTPVNVVVTVYPVAAISGTLMVCSGLTTSLTDAVASGVWTSSNTSAAIVGSSSGVVTGVGAGGTSTIVYTMPGNCTTAVIVTVNPAPSAILGSPVICQGQSETLSNSVGGGVWTSSNTSVATIGSSSGSLSALSGGTTIITYISTDCNPVTLVVTVNPVSPIVSSSLILCVGLGTSLSDAITGGTWTSSNTSAVIIGSSSGFATGMGTGTSTIVYTFTTGCTTSVVVTVNVSPVAIVGNHSMCLGLNTSLTDPTLGGTWTSSNTTNVTIGSASGLAYGAALGTSTITYTLANCTATTTVTVNSNPGPISGPSSGCIGFTATLSDGTTGGTWSSSDNTIVSIGSSSGFLTAVSNGSATINYTLGTGCLASMVFTVNPSPGPISGTPYICQGSSFAFGDAPGGGTWSSTNTSVAVVGTSGVVGGVNPGVATIIYTLPTTCFSTYNVTITIAPTPIAGPSSVCIGYAVTLTDGVSGGTWSVTNATGSATISGSGVVTGVSTGIVAISYTTFACNPATYVVTVNPNPTAIMGIGNLCEGSSTSLSDATVGGTWSSSNPMDTVSSTGVVTGAVIGAGTTISYTLPTGCYVTVPVIGYPNPSAILGVDSICQGQSLVLSDLTPGGVWSSSDGTIALSIAFTGEVDGVVAGTVHISYTLISGCYTTVPFKVIEPLPASVTITQSPDSILCHNSPVTLSANPLNAGSPTYEWKLFGTIYMGTGDTLRYDPTHGDFVTCVMTTHSVCAAPAVVSKDITLNVYPLVAPVVVISTLGPDTSSYLGQVYTFYTDVTYGGFSPEFQWYVDRDSIPGATNSTFTTRLYNENDTVYCVVHGTSPCDTVTYVGLSNQIIVEGKGYLSASNLSAMSDLTLFPNPNTGNFILSGTLNNTLDKELTLEVSDMLGRTVYTGKTTPHNGAVRAEINLGNDVAGGTYLLRVYTETGIQTFHFAIGK